MGPSLGLKSTELRARLTKLFLGCFLVQFIRFFAKPFKFLIFLFINLIDCATLPLNTAASRRRRINSFKSK